MNPSNIKPQPVEWLHTLTTHTTDACPPTALIDLYRALLGV